MASVDPTDQLIGRLVAGRYEVVRKLNEGGVGAVYLAMQRPLDRPVALKVLLKKHADDPTAIRRFEKEAAAIARLTHAHIITLYDFGATDDGDLYLAMELLRGQSLRELLDAAGYIPWERALHIIRGVTRALVAAHTQKIVHRDLKPENVMLVESNGDLDFAKVLDFGLARSIINVDGAPQITRHDVIPGTPAYMSPERANGISDDPRSDLYALGAMWFELLVGEPPFPGETSIKVILRHVHETPRRLSEAQPNNPVPRFIEEMILALLQKTPEERPESAKVLLNRLDAVARPAGWHVSTTNEVGRRGSHDDELRSFSNAVEALGEDLDFSIENDAPMPLLRRKSAAPRTSTPERDTPLLLTRKKSSPSISAAAGFMASPEHTRPAIPAALAAAGTPNSPPTFAPPPDTDPDAHSRSAEARASANGRQPLMTPSRGHNTEDFLRPAPDSSSTGPEGFPRGSPVTLLSPPRAPARIESLAQVAGWLSTAKTARSVGELCCAFLASRFDRVLVMDLRHHAPIALAQAQVGRSGTPSMPAIVHALQASRAVLDLAGRREAYYGPAMTGPEWMMWFGALGGSVPGAMFVGGLGREGRAAFLFYADHRDITLRPMVKDTVVLLREAAAALSVIG